MVILLMIVTCGIYGLYWYYKIAEEEKANLQDDSINPGTELLLIMFTCGIYMIYWWYMQGSRLKRLYDKKGIPAQDDSTLFLLLALFFAPAAIYILQDRLNKLYQ